MYLISFASRSRLCVSQSLLGPVCGCIRTQVLERMLCLSPAEPAGVTGLLAVVSVLLTRVCPSTSSMSWL